MAKRNKQKANSFMGIALIIAVVALVAILLVQFNVVGGGEAAQEQAEAIGAAVGSGSFCSDNADVNLAIRLLDNEGTSVAYNNATLLIKNVEDGKLTISDITDTTSTGTTLTDALLCGKPYKVYVQHNVNGTNSLSEAVDISADETRVAVVNKDITGSSRFSVLSARAKDNENDGFMFQEHVSPPAAATTQTEVGNYALNFTSTTNATAQAIGTSGVFDVTLGLTATESDGVFGGPSGFLVGLDTADDTNLDDWDEDTVEISLNGAVCSSDGISANDADALSTFEVRVKCSGTIDDTGKDSLNIVMNAGDGIDPDFDPNVRLVHLGDYQSNEEPNEVLTGIGFQDNGDTQTALATVQRIRFDIS